MISFERNKDPRKSMNIGMRQKRVFRDIEDAAQWCLLFPEEYTDGIVDDWFGHNPENKRPFFNFVSGRFNGDALFLGDLNLSWDDPRKKSTGKLRMVKWAKENLHFEADPKERIGLKECKAIMDRLEELVMHEYYKRTRNGESIDSPEDELIRISKFIDSIQASGSALRMSQNIPAREGWDSACYYIKQFIEGLGS